MRLAGQVARKLGEDDPEVRLLLERVAEIAMGHRRARYVGEQFRALRELLDRRLGRPTQPVKAEGELRVTVAYADEPGDGPDEPDGGR